MGIYIEDLDDIHEPEPVPEGLYEVEIVDATYTPGDNARINVQVAILNPPDENPNPPFIRPALFLPDESKEAWKVNQSKLNLKRFYHLFRLDAPKREMDDEETAEWVGTWRGKRAKCKVKQSYNDRMDRNENALVVPPLPAPGASASTSTRSKKSAPSSI